MIAYAAVIAVFVAACWLTHPRCREWRTRRAARNALERRRYRAPS